MERLESLLDRLERVTDCLEKTNIDRGDMNKYSSVRSQFTSQDKKGSTDSKHSLTAYDELVSGPVQEFLSHCVKIGGDVKSQGDLLKACFLKQRELLVLVSTNSNQNSESLKPMGSAITAVIDFKDTNRKSPYFDHLSAVAAFVGALGWVNNVPAPCSFVKNLQESGQYFSNRVLRDFREKGPEHAAWTRALTAIWTHLHDYLQQYHMSGLVWNSSDGALPDKTGVVPPPPPMIQMPESKNFETFEGPDNRGALFSQLNRGEAVTSGLRKVTDDMKTHKNPALRTGDGLQPTDKPSSKSTTNSSSSVKSPRKPVKELQGNKWVVENFVKQHIQITETEPKQTVYAFNCEGCTIEVRGKINSIVLDSCKKTGLVFDHLISSLDVVNCRSVQTQVVGQLFTVNVDKTDGCQIYLSAESKEADIVTAKSSEINVLIPKGDNDFDEYAIPEQFKSKFTGSGMHTTHYDAA